MKFKVKAQIATTTAALLSVTLLSAPGPAFAALPSPTPDKSVTLTTGLGAVAHPQSSQAAAPSANAVQAQIDQQLRDHPGGVQDGPNSVVYQNGTVRVVFADPQTGRVPTDNAHRPEAAQAAAELSMKTFAGTIQPLTGYLYGCPFGLSVVWYCFYQNASYGGRMLEFKDCSTLYPGLTQYFTTYGFDNQVSSWVNNTWQWISVYNDTALNYWLWDENGQGHSSYVGNANNDKASAFQSWC